MPYTVNDVEGFKQALLETGFEAENLRMLHDKQERRFQPEGVKIMKELRMLLAQVGPDDTLVIALSGHGLHFKGDKTGYFCPVDADLSDKTTLIAMEGEGGLYELLKGCKAKRKLLLVNACRNDPTSERGQAATKIALDDDDAGEVPEGIAALYSCKRGQLSYYDPKREKGIFFDYLTRAWRGEFAEADEAMTHDMLFDKVASKTQNEVSRLYGHSQKPDTRREFEGKWVVSLPEDRLTFRGEEEYRRAFVLENGMDKVKIDTSAALSLYRDAADQGYALGQLSTGVMFDNGWGVSKDEAEAARWFRKAADQGVAVAQLTLGVAYANGHGISKDDAEAAKWFRKAPTKANPMHNFISAWESCTKMARA